MPLHVAWLPRLGAVVLHGQHLKKCVRGETRAYLIAVVQAAQACAPVPSARAAWGLPRVHLHHYSDRRMPAHVTGTALQRQALLHACCPAATEYSGSYMVFVCYLDPMRTGCTGSTG